MIWYQALDEGRVKVELTNYTDDGGANVVYVALFVDDESGKKTSSLMLDIKSKFKVSLAPPSGTNPKDVKRWANVKRDKITNEIYNTAFSFSENSNVELMDLLQRIDDTIYAAFKKWVDDEVLFNFNVDRSDESDIGYKPLYADVPAKDDKGVIVPDKFTRFASIKVDLRTQKKGPLVGKQKTTLKERVDGKLRNLTTVKVGDEEEKITGENLSEVLRAGVAINSCILTFDIMSYGAPHVQIKGHSASIMMLIGEVSGEKFVINTDNELIQSVYGNETDLKKEIDIENELIQSTFD